AGCMAANNHGTDDPVCAKHGDRDQRTPAALSQDAQVRIEWHLAKVWEHLEPALLRGFAEEGVIKSYPGATKSLLRFLAGTVGGLEAELPGVLVELIDRAAVCAGHLYRLLDDRVEHLGEVQAEAFRLTHCVEGLELSHLAPELVGA